MILPSEILFRELNEEDASQFHEIVSANKSRLSRYFPITISRTKSLKATKEYLVAYSLKQDLKDFYVFGLFKDNQLIGVLFVKSINWEIPKCELAYFIDQDWEGKGITTWGVDQLTKFCFKKLEMNKIFLRFERSNFSSRKVALKNGFRKEGTLRSEFKVETGELIDLEYFGKIKR